MRPPSVCPCVDTKRYPSHSLRISDAQYREANHYLKWPSLANFRMFHRTLEFFMICLDQSTNQPTEPCIIDVDKVVYGIELERIEHSMDICDCSHVYDAQKEKCIDISVSCNSSVVLCRSDVDVLLSHCDGKTRQTGITSDHNAILSMSAGSRLVCTKMPLLKEFHG